MKTTTLMLCAATALVAMPALANDMHKSSSYKSSHSYKSSNSNYKQKMDANNDGRITPAEHDMYRQERMARWEDRMNNGKTLKEMRDMKDVDIRTEDRPWFFSNNNNSRY